MATQTVTQTLGGSADLLRRSTRIDAVLTGVLGLDMLIFAQPLAGLTGLPSVALLAFGALFAGAGLGVYLLAGRPGILRPLGQVMLLQNLAWVLALPLVVAAGWLPLTAIGAGSMVVLALACGAFAAAEWAGLRRMEGGA